ncbi:MAG: AAA family ATPase [Clostridia bacterium]|nr:AAA family ATPase [Clostridia bacterium]
MRNKKVVKIIAGLSSVLFCNSGVKTSADLKDFFYISKIIKAIGGLLSDVSIMSRNVKVGVINLEGGSICYFRRGLSPLTFISPARDSFFDIVSSRVIGTEKQIEILKELGTVYVSKKIAMETGKYVHGANNIGILMSGPSGCGKTLLATVFAHTLVADGFNNDGTINKNCKSVYRLSSAAIDSSSKEPIWSQLLSEKRMAQKGAAIANNPFKAYIQANPDGGVIIFDEFDKIYNSSLAEGFRNIIEHGKIDLDGITYEMSNYVFLFTTNASPSSIYNAPNPELLAPEEESYGYIRCKFDKSFLNRLVLLEFQPLSASALYSIFYDSIESWNNIYEDSGIKLEVPVEVAAQIGIYLKETHKGGREAGNLFDTLIPYLSLIELSMGSIPEDERKDIVLKVGFNNEKGKCFISGVLKNGVLLNINNKPKENSGSTNKNLDNNEKQDNFVKKSENKNMNDDE